MATVSPVRIEAKVTVGMTKMIPNRFLFDFEFPLRYRAKIPSFSSTMKDWDHNFFLPKLGEMDGQREFADVWACWNESGICIACRVKNKRHALECDPVRFWMGDNLRLCTDMRDARSNKRATRFCQQFYFLPTGDGPGRDKPVAGVNKLKRAREDAPSVPADQLKVTSRVSPSGYSLQALVPASCLNGFDPSQYNRIGFYYILEDRDHGRQYLTVGDDLYWYVDPSTWATAVLTQ